MPGTRPSVVATATSLGPARPRPARPVPPPGPGGNRGGLDRPVARGLLMTGQSSLTPAMSGPGRPSPLTPKAPGSPTVDAGVARGRPRPWPPSVSTLARRVRSKDPGFWAVKRSVRAAVVMPAAFGLTFVAFSDGQVSLFAAFGAFALLLLVDFPGRPRTRLVSYVALFAAGAVFIALGTVVSTHKVAAVVTMAVVGFIVLFAGIVAPQAATGSTAALLTFVLPVAVAEPPSQIGPRLVGWAIAAALCHPRLHARVARPVARRAPAPLVGRGVGHRRRLVRAHAEGRVDPGARAAVTEEVVRLRAQFGATPYPPTGAAPGAVALAKLVGRTEWVAQSAAQVGDEEASLALTPVRAVSGAVADTLADSAALICDGGAHPVRRPRADPGARGLLDPPGRPGRAPAGRRGDGPGRERRVGRPGRGALGRSPRRAGGPAPGVVRPELPRPGPGRGHRTGGRRHLGGGRRAGPRVSGSAG